MSLKFKRKKISFWVLTTCFFIAFVSSASANFSYHCEHFRTKNGKSNTNDRITQISFDKHFPVNQLIYLDKEQNQIITGTSFSKDKLRIYNGIELHEFLLIEDYKSLQELRNSLHNILAKDFQTKQLRYKIAWLMNPISGEVSRTIRAYWGVKNLSGLLDIQLLPSHRKIVKTEQLPFLNTGYHAGELFFQTEKETGFVVNYSTLIRGDHLVNKLMCRNRQLKEAVGKLSLPQVTVKKLNSKDIFINALLELVIESLLHNTPHSTSVPRIVNKLQSNKTFLQTKNLKEETLNEIISSWLVESRHPHLLTLNYSDQEMLIKKLQDILKGKI